MDETTPDAPPAPGRTRVPRRRPRAAGARRAATVLSVAAALGLGGVLAWRDGLTATTAQAGASTASSASPTSSAPATTSSGSSSSDTSSSSTSSSSHTSTRGS